MIFYYLTRDSAKKKKSVVLELWTVGRDGRKKSRAKSGTARVYSLNDLRTRAGPDFSRVISLSRPD